MTVRWLALAWGLTHRAGKLDGRTRDLGSSMRQRQGGSVLHQLHDMCVCGNGHCRGGAGQLIMRKNTTQCRA